MERAALNNEISDLNKEIARLKSIVGGTPTALGRMVDAGKQAYGTMSIKTKDALDAVKNGTARAVNWTKDNKVKIELATGAVITVAAGDVIAYLGGKASAGSPTAPATQQKAVATSSTTAPATTTTAQTTAPAAAPKTEPQAKTNDTYRPGSTTTIGETSTDTTKTEEGKTDPGTQTQSTTDYSPWVGAAAGLAGAAGIYGLGSQFSGLRKKKNKLLRATLALLGGAGIGYGAYRLSQPETKTASYLDFKQTYRG